MISRKTYALDADSLTLGLTINASNGRILWSPGNERIASEPYTVTVTVSDGRGESVAQSFRLSVVADTLAPVATLTATPKQAAVGANVTLYVGASDNIGVASTTLMLLSVRDTDGTVREINREIAAVEQSSTATNGSGQPGSESGGDIGNRASRSGGRGTYTILASDLGESRTGILTFGVRATDTSGNISEWATATVLAVDPTNLGAPTVAITSHTTGGKVTGPVDIIGTVKDETALLEWSLTVVSLETNKEIHIASGNNAIENGVLGRFDTTMLKNGTYQLVLSATDTGGHTSEKVVNVEVEGYYKLGNFTMTFTDFDIQLSGLPITITRTYDTLNEGVKGDFGFGWTLDIDQYQLLVDYGDGEPVKPVTGRGLQNGDILYFVLPDGTKEGFSFHAQPIAIGYWESAYYFKPVFTPLVGTKSTLIYDGDVELIEGTWGYEDNYAYGYAYTPFNSFFGGVSIEGSTASLRLNLKGGLV